MLGSVSRLLGGLVVLGRDPIRFADGPSRPIKT